MTASSTAQVPGEPRVSMMRHAFIGRAKVAPGETVALLHSAPPCLSLLGVSVGMERGCQQNDSLAVG